LSAGEGGRSVGQLACGRLVIQRRSAYSQVLKLRPLPLRRGPQLAVVLHAAGAVLQTSPPKGSAIKHEVSKITCSYVLHPTKKPPPRCREPVSLHVQRTQPVLCLRSGVVCRGLTSLEYVPPLTRWFWSDLSSPLSAQSCFVRCNEVKRRTTARLRPLLQRHSSSSCYAVPCAQQGGEGGTHTEL
jgi:hypothetical protein